MDDDGINVESAIAVYSMKDEEILQDRFLKHMCIAQDIMKKETIYIFSVKDK